MTGEVFKIQTLAVIGKLVSASNSSHLNVACLNVIRITFENIS